MFGEHEVTLVAVRFFFSFDFFRFLWAILFFFYSIEMFELLQLW